MQTRDLLVIRHSLFKPKRITYLAVPSWLTGRAVHSE